MNLSDPWGVLSGKGGPEWKSWTTLLDEDLRLELVLVEALHREADRLAAPADR